MTALVKGYDELDRHGQMTIGLVVLGAGLSSRFGDTDKLTAKLRGKPLAHHVLSTIGSISWTDRILVCRQQSDWVEAYAEQGFQIVRNDHPDRGMLGSLRAGANHVAHSTLAMICLADMPFVTSAHVQGLLSLASSSSDRAVASSAEGYLGPPAIFPVAALKQLPDHGEGGARSLLANALFVSCPLSQLLDIDTHSDLKSAEASGLERQKGRAK